MFYEGLFPQHVFACIEEHHVIDIISSTPNMIVFPVKSRMISSFPGAVVARIMY